MSEIKLETCLSYGLIILIIIAVFYKKTQSKCDKYVSHFDKLYYDLPIITTVVEQPKIKENLNDMKTTEVTARITPISKEKDITMQRWSGCGKSHSNQNGALPDSYQVNTPSKLNNMYNSLYKSSDLKHSSHLENPLSKEL